MTKDQALSVAPQTVVSLRYCLKNSRGDILENNRTLPPISYLHGAGRILPLLEAALVGLKAGEEKMITLLKADYPGLDDNFSFEVIIDEVRPATEDEQKQGYPSSPTTDNECGPGCCC